MDNLQILYSVLRHFPSRGPAGLSKIKDAVGQFKLICRLLRMNAIEPDAQFLSEAIATCQAQRNDVIHSIWIKEPETGQLMMCLFRGEWSTESGMEDKSRKTNPEGRPYTLEEAKSLTNLIDGTIEELLTFNALLYERQSSLQKSQSPSP